MTEGFSGDPAGSVPAHDTRNPQSSAKIGDHPIHPMLIPFPIVLFILTFIADVGFLTNDEPGWARASVYFLAGGLVMALLAALAGFWDFFGDRRIAKIGDAWQHMVGNLAVVALQAVNLFLRYEDPAATIAPTGVVLSGVVVLLLLFNGWKGWNLVYRHHVGIKDTGPTLH